MASSLILATQIYLGVGLLVGLLFLSLVLSKLVDGARGSSPLLRLLVLPGATLLWPLVLWKWRGGGR